jgi:hypothetical protein
VTLTNRHNVHHCAELMKDYYDAVGFLPFAQLEKAEQEGRLLCLYRKTELLGYILYGKMLWGKPIHVYQLVIAKHRNGYGEMLFNIFLQLCRYNGVSSVLLRCAENLESNKFWSSMGMQVTQIYEPKNQRKRKIFRYRLPLHDELFDENLR